MLQVISTAFLLVCWAVYVPLFVRRRGSGGAQARRDASSKWGIVLQYGGAATAWVWRRPLFTPLPVTNPILQIVAPLVAIILAAGSVHFSRVALKTLGRQWSFVASVNSGHRLVQVGPYSIVRHPLYTCFFGLTLATAIVWTAPWGLLLATILFWIGTSIRVRTEEKLLRQSFGAEFDEYVRRVPAFLPFR